MIHLHFERRRPCLFLTERRRQAAASQESLANFRASPANAHPIPPVGSRQRKHRKLTIAGLKILQTSYCFLSRAEIDLPITFHWLWWDDGVNEVGLMDTGGRTAVLAVKSGICMDLLDSHPNPSNQTEKIST
jgi:hypothetical protein